MKERGSEEKSELFLPHVVDELINSGMVTVKVLLTDDRWFGVTYKEDMLFARKSIKRLIEQEQYPKKLWKK